MNARETALDVLLELEKGNAFANDLIHGALDKYNYEDPRDKALFGRLTEGVLERRITLDYALDQVSKTPVRKMKPLIKNLLRLSAYQILYMDNVPASAACNEAVKLAKKRGFSSLGGFVNGVLRALTRKKDQLEWPDREKDAAAAMSIQYSIPQWLVEKWLADYGLTLTDKILSGIEKERPVTIRFRESLGEDNIKAYVKQIEKAGVFAEPHSLYSCAYVLSGCEGVSALPGFSEGAFYVQDVSSMLAAEAAGIREGMNILDVCAAPGGKTLLAAEKLKGSGKILSRDVSEAKALRIRQNVSRMGYENIDIGVWDARLWEEALNGWADVVLADVPCSGFGVMGRKKDIRYRVKEEDLEALVRLQKEILSTVWQYVKPGGVLLYSTCTINRAENEDMARFITDQFPFEPDSLDFCLPDCLKSAQTAKGCCQLLPGAADTDGFFIARLVRKV